MKIKNGYGNKELQIKFCAEPNEKCAQMWINFGCKPKPETLSYLSFDELLELKKEIKNILIKLIE